MKVTIKEFHAFIKAQPDDRPIDMGENRDDHPCGCVMVHYGRKYFPGQFISCGFYTWLGDGETLAEFEKGIGIWTVIQQPNLGGIFN